MKRSELAYRPDSERLFAAVADEPWSLFLDSGVWRQGQGGQGARGDQARYDIIVARPPVTFETFGPRTLIRQQGRAIESREDPFLLLKKYLGRVEKNDTGLPFCGGAAGCFAYDLGRRIETLPAQAADDLPLPDMAVGIYDWAVIVDHQRRQSWLAGACRFAETAANWPALHALFSDPPACPKAPFNARAEVKSNLSKAGYTAAFNRIKDYIRAGDCYQVNLAQRFSADFAGSGWAAYRRLCALNPAPFAAYLNLPQCRVLSASPERFLRVIDGQVETRPIKGTQRRSVFAAEDRALAGWLLESEKERAENLMIVDLLRNDLGKSCAPGSIGVPRLFALESYATVHHLVSTVTGRLAQDKHALDLLRGCFPGGSITGAPKLRAMQIIEELEPHRRNLYCGAIAYIGFDGNMDSNICIRTLIQYEGRIYFHAGGGIVWDSRAGAEYEECFSKAAALLKLFAADPP